ncbi:MAG: NAD-dependent epimerase/dehydratase family protein [Gammaproteobacteria bacterium]|nr:NAD-dependent epimerase/dehydratase family protein [Gammaproteobacteria bacterium]
MTSAYEDFELIFKSFTDEAIRLSVVWSAGKSGFYSSEKETDQEFLVFQGLVSFVSMLRKKLHPGGFSFHCISSAGGLFEGQRVINKSSDPTPLRPYGKLKMRQEHLLLNSFDNNELSIYRPSSVYGPTARQSRHGLINNLVSNARNGRITVLDAHIMALRDYVFAGDVGNFIGKRIRFEMDSPADNPVYFLVSAKCSAIFEVFTKIKRILNLHAQFRYDDQFGNHKNITFSDDILPLGWRPTPLDVGIRQFINGRLT